MTSTLKSSKPSSPRSKSEPVVFEVMALLRRRPMSMPEVVIETGRSLSACQNAMKKIHVKTSLDKSRNRTVYHLLEGKELMAAIESAEKEYDKKAKVDH